MTHPRSFVARAGLLLWVLVLAACGGDSQREAEPGQTVLPLAQVRGAYTLEELQAKAQRAGRHQTVYAELQHPGAGRPELSRRTVPYRFETATRQNVCIDTSTPHGHRVEIRRSGSGGPALAELHAANPCQEVAFEAGDYDAVVQHGGTGAIDAPVQVFASARFTQTDNASAFGRWLVQNNAATAKASARAAEAVRPKAAADAACQFIESIALGLRNGTATPTYLSSTLAAQNVALFELRDTTQTLLTTSGASASVSASQLLRVYACGTDLKFQASNGLYLASSCGYPLFSATTLAAATAYTPYWDAEHRRLDLVNTQTQALLKAVPRTEGLVVDPATHREYPTQPSVGTCSTPLPPELRTGVPGFKWDSVGLYISGLQQQVAAVAEFAYRPLGTYSVIRSTGVGLVHPHIGVSRIAVGFGASYARFDVGAANLDGFRYPVDVDLDGGFVPSHQDVLVFSFGQCAGCDLTGLDLSGRSLAELDVQGSTLAHANFANAYILAANFDNAQIAATDFTNARFASVSFAGATITSATDAGTVTRSRFDGTRLASPGFPASFQQATVSDAQFANVDLTGSQWAGASVTNTAFSNVLLDQADLTGSRWTTSTLTGSSLQGAKFDNASVDDLTVTFAPAQGASFRGASLTRLQMPYANLAGASFAGASLTGSSLNYAFAVGTDFSSTTWVDSSLDYAQAYSDGAQVTRFDGCTVASGSFANSLFMQSSFDKCRFQGGGFSNSIFAAASFANATSSIDATNALWSMASTVLSGANFTGANLDAGDLTNAIVSTAAGSKDIAIRISPYLSPTTPGQAVVRTYYYGATLLPPSVGARLICPSGGLCLGGGAAAWQAARPPVNLGPENVNAW